MKIELLKNSRRNRLVMMTSRETGLRLLFSGLLLVSVLYGYKVTYPDNVHLSYGFPMRWGTHQLITIAGPVDKWTINLMSLFIDLIIWLAVIVVVPELVKMWRS